MLLTAPPHWPGGVGLGEPPEDAPGATVGAAPNEEEETRSSQGAQMVPFTNSEHCY